MHKNLLREDWENRAREITFDVTPFIDGQHCASASDIADVVSPATGQILYSLHVGCQTDVDKAVASARRTFLEKQWRSMSIAARKASLMTIARLIELHREEFALLESLETGKVISKAYAEIAIAIDFFNFYAEAIDKSYGDVAPSDGTLMALSTHEPRGVIGAIVPWNFPLANAAYKVAPALAAGNSVVLKPSEVASSCALRLAELAIEAGVPPGVFNVVPGLGQIVGAALARHEDVDLLTFTGSTATGRMLMRYAGESNGKPLMLECGGKSPQIILADMADEIQQLAQRIVDDMFWNQGQWCAARSRLIVEEPLYDELLDAVVSNARKLVPGHPLDPSARFGAIASGQQFDRIQSHIQMGLREGGRVILHGPIGTPCAWSMAPTIFGDVERHMTIAREEIFGPVLCAFRAASAEDATSIANDSPYGLGATIWTHDARKAFSAVRQLSAGRIAVRTSTKGHGTSGLSLSAEPAGASGFGVEKGLHGLRSYCRLRSLEVY